MADSDKARKETLRQIKIKTGVVKRWVLQLQFEVKRAYDSLEASFSSFNVFSLKYN